MVNTVHVNPPFLYFWVVAGENSEGQYEEKVVYVGKSFNTERFKNGHPAALKLLAPDFNRQRKLIYFGRFVIEERNPSLETQKTLLESAEFPCISHFADLNSELFNIQGNMGGKKSKKVTELDECSFSMEVGEGVESLAILNQSIYYSETVCTKVGCREVCQLFEISCEYCVDYFCLTCRKFEREVKNLEPCGGSCYKSIHRYCSIQCEYCTSWFCEYCAPENILYDCEECGATHCESLSCCQEKAITPRQK